MTALTPRFGATADNPYLALFGIEEAPADPATLDSYRVSGRRTIAAHLARGDIELTAVNPTVAGNKVSPGTWAVACLSPAFPSPGFWHIGVVLTGGILEVTVLPVAGSRAGVYLKRIGVPVADFKPSPASPVANNPWGADADQPEQLRTVYFIQPAAGGLIKIGIASDVKSRLASLQTGSPVELRVIGLIHGVGRFAAGRRHGEWFEPTPELVAYIAEHAAVSA